MAECTKKKPCRTCELHEERRTEDVAAVLAKACQFRAGSLYCINDPCKNSNHREKP